MRVFESSSRFTFLKCLEANWELICEEYLQVSPQSQLWHEKNLHNGLWETIGLYQFGKWLPESNLCPVTTRCLKEIPELFLAGFSVLNPDCRILPHAGYSGEVWRSHLGLICPDAAWIEVAGERYVWQPGRSVIFDDTQIHSAANESATQRVVLIADFFK
jgi:beta-hydroxylase